MNTELWAEKVSHFFLKYIVLYFFGFLVLGVAFAATMGWIVMELKQGGIYSSEDIAYTIIYSAVCYLISMVVTKGKYFDYILDEVQHLDELHSNAMSKFDIYLKS